MLTPDENESTLLGIVKSMISFAPSDGKHQRTNSLWDSFNSELGGDSESDMASIGS